MTQTGKEQSCCCEDGSGGTDCGARPATQVTTKLTPADRRGTRMVRWGFRRDSYRVAPGLYFVGNPTPESPVFLSANYKLSFDTLRSSLPGIDAWLLVLDTRGINVWCAAGKGTFCTEEIVRQVKTTGLAEIVTHRKLIAPQLGAPGVAAHEVRKGCDFSVVWGPVRAQDIPAFLAAGNKATSDMRRVRFTTADRFVLVRVEFMGVRRYGLWAMAALLLLAGLGTDIYSPWRIATVGIPNALMLLWTVLSAAVLVPLLLPWLPGRAFALKGFWVGAAAAAVGIPLLSLASGLQNHWPTMVAWGLAAPAVASFMAMNFTGASTYTSPSGVRREMKFAVPLQASAAGLGTLLWFAGRFF